MNETEILLCEKRRTMNNIIISYSVRYLATCMPHLLMCVVPHDYQKHLV